MKKNEKKVKKENTGGVSVGGTCTASFSFSIGFAPVEPAPPDELPILAEFSLSETEYVLWSYLHNEHDCLLFNSDIDEVLRLSKAALDEKATTKTPTQSGASEKLGVTTVTETFEPFDEYGTAWENEVMKLPHAVLLSMLSDDTKKRCAEMLDGHESKMYLMRILKIQIMESQSTKV
jgi:hypothetical protein